MRTVGAVVLGYVVMFVVVFVTFSATYLVLGAEGAFRPGSYEVSGAWIAVSLVLGFVAAVVGGVVSVAVGRSPRAPKVLAAVVLGLGLLLALPVFTRRPVPPRPREASVGNLEAMQSAEQPTWIALLNPLIGAAGVMLGARLGRRTAA